MFTTKDFITPNTPPAIPHPVTFRQTRAPYHDPEWPEGDRIDFDIYVNGNLRAGGTCYAACIEHAFENWREEFFPAPPVVCPHPVVPAIFPPPDPADVRGTCPLCGQPTVVFFEYFAGRGYLFGVQCWALVRDAGCGYRRVD